MFYVYYVDMCQHYGWKGLVSMWSSLGLMNMLDVPMWVLSYGFPSWKRNLELKYSWESDITTFLINP